MTTPTIDQLAEQAAKRIYEIDGESRLWLERATLMIRGAIESATQALREQLDQARARIEYVETQLGLVYCHVTNGKLSKPYGFKDVESAIDDEITETCREYAQEQERRIAELEQQLAQLITGSTKEGSQGR